MREHAWIMSWWRLVKLTAKATMHELIRSNCKAEQCSRDIEFTVARERVEARKSEQAAAKRISLRGFDCAKRRCILYAAPRPNDLLH